MNTQIDLSKAYAGQIATLSNGQTLEIDRIGKSDTIIIIWDFFGLEYVFNYFGKYIGKAENFNSDIVSLSEPIQVQIARLEGEIKGLKKSLFILDERAHLVRGGILLELYNANRKVIVELEQQLKTLQDENS